MSDKLFEDLDKHVWLTSVRLSIIHLTEKHFECYYIVVTVYALVQAAKFET